jgi:hypothetical protein
LSYENVTLDGDPFFMSKTCTKGAEDKKYSECKRIERRRIEFRV